MHKVFVALCTGLLLIVGQLPASAQQRTKSKKSSAAQEKSNYFYLVPTLGVYSFAPDDEFKTGPLYGFLFGYQLKGKGVVDRLGVEGFVAAIDTHSRKDNHAGNGYLFRAEAIYDLITGRFIPFLSLGAGGLFLDSKTDSDTRFIVTPGVGIKYALNNQLDLRLDLRRNFPFDPKDNLNSEFTVGLTYLFDDVRTIASPPPPDADGDKVRDAADKCPDTPRGQKVDQFGCPQDTDGDGVADFKDKCPDTLTGVKVDLSGCTTDTDGDGVANDVDLCSATPPGIMVNAQGCVPTPELTRIFPAIPPVPPARAAIPADRAIVSAPGIVALPEIVSVPGVVAAPGVVSPETAATPEIAVAPGIVAAPGIASAPELVAAPGIASAPAVATSARSVVAGLERIHFKFDSYALDGNAKRILRQNATWLQANPGIKISVEGHCDVRGSNNYNIVLGEKRAKAAKAYLVTLGIAADRISVNSYGEEKLLDPASSRAASARNRRVDFVPQ